ncbi:MAG: NAD(P)-dependent oxidoreductase [Nannocystaceae bacterium]
MRILLTGAFGNIGSHTAAALLARGFEVTTFDRATPAARKLARRLAPATRVRTEWGDLRDADRVAQVVRAAAPDAIIHLAAVIPPPAYFDAALARAVNVDGLGHLLAAATASPRPPRIVFASSYTIHGPRNGARELALLDARTPVAPADAYGGHKVEGEWMVRRSGLPWVTLRLGACLPLSTARPDPRVMRMAFELPRENRSHAVDQRDAALAFANAVDADALGKILLIGGDSSFRLRARDLSRRYQRALGLDPFPDDAYATPDDAVDGSWYFEDWMDTRESQALLRFQRHTFDDYLAALTRANRIPALLLRPFAGPIGRRICRESRYHGRPAAPLEASIEERFAAHFVDAARPQPESLVAAEALNRALLA